MTSEASLPVAAEDGSVHRRGVRRRLVQSTLFPQRTEDLEMEVEVVEEEELRCGGGDGGGEEVVVAEDEDCGGSLKKRTRGKAKAKAKETSTPRRTSSGRAKQHPNSSTPRKNGISNSRKCGLVPKMLDLNEVDDGLPQQSIPNLRMEAKTAAEENSRLFAGKQIHPFFLSRRSEKKSQDVVEHEGQECCTYDDGDSQSASIGPIHVFEKNQEDNCRIRDWGSLTFSADTSYSEQFFLDDGAFSSIFRGNIRSLTFDTFKSISNAFDALTMPNNVLSPTNIADVPHVDSNTSNDAKLDQREKFLEHAECMVKLDDETDSRFLKDSVQPDYVARGSCHSNALWTDKYKPRRFSEVCGNHESVKFLSEWLQHWHGSNRERNEGVNGCENHYSQHDKCIQDRSDSDSDCRGMEAQLKNVMLITGPVGCGKSAAVYACAKEQGFEIMEVNASECRNGTVVKQKFGEALKSQGLKRLSGNQGDFKRKKAHPMVENCKSEHEGSLEQIELIRVSDGENSNEYGEQVSSSHAQVEVKCLILFEDVDITFFEDRGFISSIQQIAETAKGPLIMTSNNSDLVLPENLERHHIFFSMPSAKELLYHLQMICLAEKVNIHCYLLKKFVGSCGGDIRKAILHLQFWCQGSGCQRDGILQRSYGPALLDLESCHRIIPKLMPWDCHSELSKLVEKNIAESLCLMEQAYSSMEVIEESVHEELDHPAEISQIDINLESKKEAMLRRNCSSYEDGMFVQSGMECQITNSPGTPLTFSHNKSCRKLGILMLSNSEDDSFQDKDISLSFEAGTEIKRVVFSPGKVIQNCRSQSYEKQCLCEELNKVKCPFPCSNRQANINFNEPSESVDISRVLESTYVPETEIGNGRELSTGGFCGNDAVMGDVSPGDWSIQDLSPVKCRGRSLSRLQRLYDMEETNCGATVSPHREAEDIHVEQRDHFVDGWKIMDECSRIEFNHRCKHDASCPAGPNLVEQSWARLRGDQQLKNFVNAEQKDASRSIEFVNEMANLISEADLLLCRCQEVMEDFLEPATICDEPEAFSWCADQWLMASAIIQHGVCLYARDVDAVASNKGLQSRIDLAYGMLALARNKNAAAKLTIPSSRGCLGLEQEMLGKSDPLDVVISGRKTKTSLFDVVQSIIPCKRHLCIRGDTFHEYVSFLGCISKAECSRLSQGVDNNKRGRRARHYLSSSLLMLTPEDISLLCKHGTRGKDTS